MYQTAITVLHYTEKNVLTGIPVKNWNIMLEYSFTAYMPPVVLKFRGQRCLET